MKLLAIANSLYIIDDLVDIFFKAKLEHLVCLIQNDGLEVSEVDIASLNVVEYTASCSDENVDTPSEITDLLINADATVDSDNFEVAIVVLHLG